MTLEIRKKKSYLEILTQNSQTLFLPWIEAGDCGRNPPLRTKTETEKKPLQSPQPAIYALCVFSVGLMFSQPHSPLWLICRPVLRIYKHSGTGVPEGALTLQLALQAGSPQSGWDDSGLRVPPQSLEVIWPCCLPVRRHAPSSIRHSLC